MMGAALIGLQGCAALNQVRTEVQSFGDWPATRDFWDGFFNPTFWPSLVLRFALGLMLAGLFGFATALGIGDEEARETMLRASSRWAVAAAPVLLVSGWWYVDVLPESVRDFFLRRASEMAAYRAAWPAMLLAVAVGSMAHGTT